MGLGLTNHVAPRVIGPDTATAAALATALTVVEPDNARRVLSIFPQVTVSIQR